MKQRQPKDISQILDDMRQKGALTEAADLVRIKESWAEITGELYAKYSRPASLKKGELTISFDNSVWKSEFYLNREKIIGKINEFMGFIAVKSVVLV